MARTSLHMERMTDRECLSSRTDLNTSTGTAALQHDGGFGVQAAPGFELAGRGLSLNLSANLALVTLPASYNNIARLQLDHALGTTPSQHCNDDRLKHHSMSTTILLSSFIKSSTCLPHPAVLTTWQVCASK